MPAFSGIWVALVTPFADGELDLPALQRLARHLLDAGAAGLVACGSTGEAAALSRDERLAVLDALLEVVPGERLVMGLAGNNLNDVLGTLDAIQQRPIGGVLVPAPYYIRPSQPGLLNWFSRIADASRLPVILYDIPYRTGATLALDTLRQLARHPRIVALKDCGGDTGKTQALIADGQLAVLAGEDNQVFTTLCLGGSGAIAASAHHHTERFVEMAACVQRGDLARAQALAHSLQPLIELAFAEPNPAPVKSLLALRGLIRDELREPMQPSSPALVERLHSLLI